MLIPKERPLADASPCIQLVTLEILSMLAQCSFYTVCFTALRVRRSTGKSEQLNSDSMGLYVSVPPDNCIELLTHWEEVLCVLGW